MDELEIRKLAERYCMSVDEGMFDEFEALFTPEARMHVMGMTHEGARGVRAFIEAAQPPELRGKHFIASHLIEVDPSGLSALGWCDFAFIDRDGNVPNSGRYHDRYSKDDSGRWRFTLREIVFTGEQPEISDPVRIGS